jgi:hypothetical protein
MRASSTVVVALGAAATIVACASRRASETDGVEQSSAMEATPITMEADAATEDGATEDGSTSTADAADAADAKKKLDCNEPAVDIPDGGKTYTTVSTTNYWGTHEDSRDDTIVKNERLAGELALKGGNLCIVGAHGSAGKRSLHPFKEFIAGCKGNVLLSICEGGRRGDGNVCSMAEWLADYWEIDPKRVIACDGCVEPRGEGGSKEEPCAIMHCTGRWVDGTGGGITPKEPGICFSNG